MPESSFDRQTLSIRFPRGEFSKAVLVLAGAGNGIVVLIGALGYYFCELGRDIRWHIIIVPSDAHLDKQQLEEIRKGSIPAHPQTHFLHFGAKINVSCEQTGDGFEMVLEDTVELATTEKSPKRKQENRSGGRALRGVLGRFQNPFSEIAQGPEEVEEDVSVYSDRATL